MRHRLMNIGIAVIAIVTTLLAMTRWNATAHACVSAATIGIALWMLTHYRHRYHLAERMGLSLIAGAGLLRLNVIYEMEHSPFFDWAPTLLMVGVLLFLKGRAIRDDSHERANAKAREQAQQWLQARGRL